MGLEAGPESIPQTPEDANLDFTKPQEKTPPPEKDLDKDVADMSNPTTRRLDARGN